MNYVKKTLNDLPRWAKVAVVGAVTGLALSVPVNVGNALKAQRELNKGYTPAQSDENMRHRFGQYLPAWYDKVHYTVGTPGREIIYMISK